MTKIFVFLSVLVVLCGCANPDWPQQVNFSPTPDVVSSDVGKNATVAVRVIDERTSKSLGFRAPYGGEITGAQDLADSILPQVIDGLRNKGFNPVPLPYGEGKDPRLAVEVRLLEYSGSEPGERGYHIKGAIKAIAVRAGNYYERMYRTQKVKRVWPAPGKKTNEQWINEALSDVLRQLLEDPELLRFLAG